MSNALQIITGDIFAAKERFLSVLTDRTLNFEREAGFAIQLLSGNEWAMKVATQNRQSVIDAVTNIAAIGISLNPAKKQAYLVPRDGKVCLDISYIGLLDLAIQSGSIRWGQAELVYSGDRFKRCGFDKPPIHEYEEFSRDRGEIVGVYVVVKTADGDYLTTTMNIDEVYAIRDRTSAWRAWMEKKKRCPWVTDEGEMVKKTVIKRAYKLWPKTERLDTAIHYLNTDGDEGLDMTGKPAAAPQSDWVDPAPLILAAQATKTDEEALAFWRANNGKLARQPAEHERLKQAVVAHRRALQAKDQACDVEAREPASPTPEEAAE